MSPSRRASRTWTGESYIASLFRRAKARVLGAPLRRELSRWFADMHSLRRILMSQFEEPPWTHEERLLLHLAREQRIRSPHLLTPGEQRILDKEIAWNKGDRATFYRGRGEEL